MKVETLADGTRQLEFDAVNEMPVRATRAPGGKTVLHFLDYYPDGTSRAELSKQQIKALTTFLQES